MTAVPHDPQEARRLLAEAGWGMYQARYRFTKRNDGTDVPGMIQVLEQGGEVPNLLSRAPTAPVQQGFAHSLIGNLASLRASLTYVTGAHNMKFGYQGGFSNPNQSYENHGPIQQVRLRNGVPNQLRQTVVVGPIALKYTRNLVPVNFYAQDQWTLSRMTLQGGIRYDSLTSSYPDQRLGGPGWPFAPVEIFFPSRSTPGYDWKDITPRFGVAYDLFGNGKTAVKFNVGKYVEAITATNSDWDMNPLTRTATWTTRGWNDADRDYVPDCDLLNPAANGECARMDNQRLGQPVFTRTFDPDWHTGWGTRPYSWTLGLSVQQEVVPRVSVSVGYNRNWWGNWYVVDNRETSLEDYTPYGIVAPSDPRLPGGGGYGITGLYNLVPSKVGQVDELAQSYKNFGDQTETWQGIDVSVVARLQNGLTVQAGAPAASSRTPATCEPDCPSWVPTTRRLRPTAPLPRTSQLSGAVQARFRCGTHIAVSQSPTAPTSADLRPTACRKWTSSCPRHGGVFPAPPCGRTSWRRMPGLLPDRSRSDAISAGPPTSE